MSLRMRAIEFRVFGGKPMSVPLESQPWFEKYWQAGLIALGTIGVIIFAYYNPIGW